METPLPPKITVFHCANRFSEIPAPVPGGIPTGALTFIPMACASMVKALFLLRAFEAGADAVVVLVCPQGACRYVEGNLRAKKRVDWVKGLLAEIGMDERRLALFHLESGDRVGAVIDDTLDMLRRIQPAPAAIPLAQRQP